MPNYKLSVELVTSDFPGGSDRICVSKSRGTLTLDDMVDALRRYMPGQYAIVLNCMPAEGEANGMWYDEDDGPGDVQLAYPLTQEDNCPVCGHLLPPFQYCPECGFDIWKEAAENRRKRSS